MMKTIFILSFSLLLSWNVNFAQSSLFNLSDVEAELIELFDSLKLARDDESRKLINDRIVNWWEEVLQDEQTITYTFSIDKVGVLNSGDGKFRIYSWNVLYEGRRPVYYAFIQYYNPKKEEIQIWFLNDISDQMKEADQKTLSHEDWYGCLYYEIVPHKSDGEIFYTLLGWDGNNALINRKIIDVLWFSSSGKPRFGKPVFSMEDPKTSSKKPKRMKRLIFEYSARASMVLKYNAEKEFIFYDHLAPIEPKYKDIRQFYAPDMTQDMLRFKKGMWRLESDADLRRDRVKKDTKSNSIPTKSDGMSNQPQSQF
jgi:hypothetical protein